MASRELGHIMHCIDSLSETWLTILGSRDETARDAMRKRSSRKRVDYVMVERAPHRYVLASGDLGSDRAEPFWGVWLPVEEVWTLLSDVVLALPGLGAVPSYSAGWRPDRGKGPDSHVVWHGDAPSLRRYEEAVEQVAAQLEQEVGQPALLDGLLSDDVPPERFDGLMNHRLARRPVTEPPL